MIYDKNIDHGEGFDWGNASADYAKYRDIYPPEFYQEVLQRGLCAPGFQVLDLGTGTGVLPRSLAPFGAHFTGADISENQIQQARRLSKEAGLDISYLVSSAEDLFFPSNTFDTVTACQCFFYFDQAVLFPQLAQWLKPGGRLAVFFMAWLPGESDIARRSEELVLKYNPSWTGSNLQRQLLPLSPLAEPFFQLEENTMLDFSLPFTRETWSGRIRACRGIGASSLSEAEKEAFQQEHLAMLNATAPASFQIPHSMAIQILRVQKDETSCPWPDGKQRL